MTIVADTVVAAEAAVTIDINDCVFWADLDYCMLPRWRYFDLIQFDSDVSLEFLVTGSVPFFL